VRKKQNEQRSKKEAPEKPLEDVAHTFLKIPGERDA
jgi:hypothetical protein